MEEDKEIALKLTVKEANIILAVLNDTPVIKLIQKITQQGNAQITSSKNEDKQE